MQIMSDDDHPTSARAVQVVWLVSTADSRTEGLHLLLTASNSGHCTAHTYLSSHRRCLQTFQRNKRCPRIVVSRIIATQKRAVKKMVSMVSDCRNNILLHSDRFTTWDDWQHRQNFKYLPLYGGSCGSDRVLTLNKNSTRGKTANAALLSADRVTQPKLLTQGSHLKCWN